jgi:hypothetical protein
MAAQNTDLFLKVVPNTGWQLGASGISDALVDNFALVSAAGLPTDTAVILTIDRVDASGVKTPSKMERIKGVVSANNVVSCIRGVEGTAQAHAGGAVVEIIISAANFNSYITAMIAGHGQTGVHDHGAVDVPMHAAATKATPVDADEIGIVDSAASWVLKKLTFANLRAALRPVTNTITSSATPAINTDTTNIFTITALAAAITSFTTSLTGTPINGQKLIVRIKDDGTARALAWGASFASRGATLPTTTVLGKYLYVGFIYNSTASVWDCVAVSAEV